MRKAGAVAVAVALMAALAFIAAPPAHAVAPVWWDEQWSFRAHLNVQTDDAVGSDYSMAITLPHASYVAAGAALADGRDLRVLRWNGSSWMELDRVLDSASSWNVSSTKVWFRTQSAIAADTVDESYWIYYGNATAGAAPADGDNVFDIWDDFSSGTIDPVKWQTLVPPGVTVTAAGGELQVVGTSQLGSQYTPAGVYTNANFTSDYAVESRFRVVSQSTESQENWKATFGLDSQYLMVNSQVSAAKRVQYYDVTWNDVGPSSLNATTFGYQRISQALTSGGIARHWENGTLQTTRMGVPLVSYAAHFDFSPDVDAAGETFDVRYDDLVVRKYVSNEPALSVGGNEGAGGLVDLDVVVEPSLSFSVAGRNATCNGMANTIGASATSVAVPLGRLAAGAQASGAQDLSVTTNAVAGFSVHLRSAHGSTPAMRGTGNPSSQIADTITGVMPLPGSEAFGYTTGDTEVAMTSGHVAPLPSAGTGDVVMTSVAPTSRSSCIGFFVSAAGTTNADAYESRVIYTAIARF